MEAVAPAETPANADARNGQPAILLDHVTKKFGDRKVLDDVTLDIRGGTAFCLLGRSGTGKSVTLKHIIGLMRPDRGHVFVHGRDVTALEGPDLAAVRRTMGFLFQNAALFDSISVGENVAIVPRLERWENDRVASRVRELLDLVGLAGHQFATRWPDELSGGQRQRVGVARALAIDPPVLLMDEPFGALDPLTRAELHGEFRRIQQRVRKTVIIVTHDMAEAFALGDRVGVIDEGRLVACDRPAAMAVAQDPRVRRLLDAIPTIDARLKPA